MSYESFRSTLITNLFDSGRTVPAESMSFFLSILDKTATRFDFSTKPTDLIVQGEFPEIAKMYIAAKAVESLSPHTLNQYRAYLQNFFRNIGKPFNAISSNDIRVYLYQYQSEHNVKDSTLDSLRTVIGCFFSWLHEEGYISINPAKRLKPIRREKAPRHAMDQLELENIRTACNTLRQKALVDFLYSTGCRASEAANMKISNVDIPSCTVYVELGKGKKSRYTYINAESQVSLTAYLNSRSDNCPYLFASERKPCHQITVSAIEREIRLIESRASVKTHVTPHIFRHTFATTAIESGMPVERLQKLLGHSHLDTTLIYTDINQKDIKNSHERFVR